MAVGLFGRLREGLAKTRETLLGKVEALFQGHPKIDEDFLESLEEILLGADFGMPVTQDLIAALRRRLKAERECDQGRLREIMAEEIGARLRSDQPWTLPTQRPCVIVLVGVNGVGKTTTIGKLAAQFVGEGKRVVIGAGDTFRAAAGEQLQVWGKRAGAEVIRHAEGADPGAVAFDAARAAVARNADVLLLDTAGRLHTKVNLMEELKKVRRVLAREIPGAPHETWLVLDATTGQNALAQARTFRAACEATGIVLTKLDGTAKGGIVVAIGAELGIGVRFVGVGEGVADLRPFSAVEFVSALFQNE
jgi:fused signal recognition particle receptor